LNNEQRISIWIRRVGARIERQIENIGSEAEDVEKTRRTTVHRY